MIAAKMEIAESGLFKGNASYRAGRGALMANYSRANLWVTKRLLIRASGHVSGTVTYGGESKSNAAARSPV